jgi:hypothetical protein
MKVVDPFLRFTNYFLVSSRAKFFFFVTDFDVFCEGREKQNELANISVWRWARVRKFTDKPTIRTPDGLPARPYCDTRHIGAPLLYKDCFSDFDDLNPIGLLLSSPVRFIIIISIFFFRCRDGVYTCPHVRAPIHDSKHEIRIVKIEDSQD